MPIILFFDIDSFRPMSYETIIINIHFLSDTKFQVCIKETVDRL